MKLNDQVTPLPWAKVIPVYITLLAESINGYSIFAYVGYMVADLLPELQDDLRKLGYYAGLLGSSFYVGQFLSSFFWGKMSDKYGRRPIMLIGTCGTMISTVIFGFSKYYGLAITARFISGLLNGNIGVVKTYLGEVTDSTNQTRAFSYFSLTSGIASIAGAIAGGYLARPAVQYPEAFSATGLFGEFPYLLVNGVAGFCLFVALVLTYFYLTENPRNNFTALSNLENGDNSLEMNTDTNEESDSIYSMKSLSKSFEEDDLIVSNYYNQQSWPKKTWNTVKKAFYNTFLKPTTDKDWSILRDHVASLACWIYALLGWIFIMLDEIFPVWSINKTEDGGLNFFTKDIGTVSAIGGVAIVIIQLFIYHRVANKLGLRNTLTVGLLITIPTFFAFPFLNFIRSNTVLFWICMGLVYVVRNFCGQLTFTAIIQMINNSVYPEHMGATNGLGQSLVAFFRMIGPTIGGSLTSWSLQLEIGWHVNHFIPFLVLMILLFCLYVLTVAKLPVRLNKPKQEQDLREALNELNFIQSSAEQ